MSGTRQRVELILARLRGHSGPTERRAVRALVRLGQRAIPDLVWTTAHHRSAFVRAVAVMALSEHGPRVRPAILHALNDRAMAVRLASLLALDKTWYRGAATPVSRLLNDPSGGIRLNAAAVLGRHRVQLAWRQLTRLLRDKRWYVRQGAARALGRIGVRDATRALMRARNDPLPAIRNAVRRALAELGLLA